MGRPHTLNRGQAVFVENPAITGLWWPWREGLPAENATHLCDEFSPVSSSPCSCDRRPAGYPRQSKSQNILLKSQASPSPSSAEMCQGAPTPQHNRPPLSFSTWFASCGISIGGFCFVTSCPFLRAAAGAAQEQDGLSLPLDSAFPGSSSLEAHSVISFQCVLYCFHCLFL